MKLNNLLNQFYLNNGLPAKNAIPSSRTKLVTLESKEELMSVFSELEEINETLLVTA